MIRLLFSSLLAAAIVIAVIAWVSAGQSKLGGSKAEGITLGEVQEVTPADMKFGL